VIPCAIYTRKSSEEGLEQDFNSLDAQREACEAFVKSQQHEGWSLLPEHYDDGGVSGATMQRPALERLLDAVTRGDVSVVVVYKVDRLTRSLTDFAKIVERFDTHGVSFVSVTQQFNTTTSMGRLTLNVLLSFAQFEREVTGERIRDKIAASKQKGLWMGGVPPLGYTVDNRKLIGNDEEAKTVRYIFNRYLTLGSVHRLQAALALEGVVSAKRMYRNGRVTGGKPLERGALYRILQNRLYRGEVVHKGQAYPGEHAAIVDEKTWSDVQSQLAAHRVERTLRSKCAAPSLLAGRLFDEHGERLTPSHAVKRGKRYRYYVSQSLTVRPRTEAAGTWRLPAGEIEGLVTERLRQFIADREGLVDALITHLPTAEDLEARLRGAASISARWDALTPVQVRALVLATVTRVTVSAERVEIEVTPTGLTGVLMSEPQAWPELKPNESCPSHATVLLTVSSTLRRAGLGKRLIIDGNQGVSRRANRDPALIALVSKAHHVHALVMRSKISTLKDVAATAGISASYLTRVIRLAYLAPDITRAILEGTQPPTLTATVLIKLSRLPLDWGEQRRVLGFI
jgi:DNA invertase Pin-like site-specific DNA recombinase